MLAQMKKKKLEEGEMIVDLSIGAPNIAPAPHILKALSEACLVPDNYLYAIQDQQALLEAVSEESAASIFFRRIQHKNRHQTFPFKMPDA